MGEETENNVIYTGDWGLAQAGVELIGLRMGWEGGGGANMTHTVHSYSRF